MGNLNVYECRRGKQADSWTGALIVAAPNIFIALQVCRALESWRADPVDAIQWQGVTASGEPRVLYNDEMR